jgi:hypothetical protein
MPSTGYEPAVLASQWLHATAVGFIVYYFTYEYSMRPSFTRRHARNFASCSVPPSKHSLLCATFQTLASCSVPPSKHSPAALCHLQNTRQLLCATFKTNASYSVPPSKHSPVILCHLQNTRQLLCATFKTSFSRAQFVCPSHPHSKINMHVILLTEELYQERTAWKAKTF